MANEQQRTMTPQARRAIAAAYFGTLIEWYDYALYGAAAGLVIGPLFFPDVIPASASMLAFATFAVGFVVRPLGGLLISHLGDRVGRKPAMILTIVLMGIATVGIGVLPTAEAIGWPRRSCSSCSASSRASVPERNSPVPSRSSRSTHPNRAGDG